MNSNINTTPLDNSDTQSLSRLKIERRRVRFDYSDIEGSTFYNNNAIVTAFWVGLSATFPVGEAEFINSVKLYKKQLKDPKLVADVADFTAQEAHHSLQHKKLNKHFDTQGYSTAKVETFMHEEISRRISRWSDKKRLMHTVSAEHVTAVMAHFALSQPHAMKDVPESFRHLFLWHAIEEVEHKSVAFDVYKSCVGDMPALKRHYAKFIFFEFPLSVFLVTRYLLKNKGHKSTWAERKEFMRFLFGKGGMISSVKHLYMMFFKRGFHPWDHDDSELIQDWKEELAPHFEFH